MTNKTLKNVRPMAGSATDMHIVDGKFSASAPEGTEIIDGASHAAYDDHPDEFTTLLLGALPA